MALDSLLANLREKNIHMKWLKITYKTIYYSSTSVQQNRSLNNFFPFPFPTIQESQQTRNEDVLERGGSCTAQNMKALLNPHLSAPSPASPIVLLQTGPAQPLWPPPSPWNSIKKIPQLWEVCTCLFYWVVVPPFFPVYSCLLPPVFLEDPMSNGGLLPTDSILLTQLYFSP